MDRVRTIAARIGHSWRALAPEQRLASVAALLLLATLFLPWYEKSFYDPAGRDYATDKLTGFGSADFVMASVVLVACAVLAMMFARGEGSGFHLPGGDGLIVMIAGGWAALLIFYRVLDHPDVSGRGATIGIQWGVFVAFLAAAFLVYAGFRIRAAHRPEPPLPAAAGDGADLRGRPREATGRGDPRGSARRGRPERGGSAAARHDRERDWERETGRPDTAPTRAVERDPGPTVAIEPPTEPTRPADAPARRRRPPEEGGQLSFDERLPER